jgi:hypothetical protein
MPETDRVDLAKYELRSVHETFKPLDVLNEVKQQISFLGRKTPGLDERDPYGTDFIVISRRVAHLREDPNGRGLRVSVFRQRPDQEE